MNKSSIVSHKEEILLAGCAIIVVCFWYFLFPHLLLMREASQLFLWNWDYFAERVVMPGGFAQYVGEFLVQFFYHPFYGALIYAALFVVIQQLVSQLIKKTFPSFKKKYRMGISLIPSFIMWKVAIIPEIPLTPTIAVIIVIAIMLIVSTTKNINLIYTCILIPVVYWMTGPAAILLLLYHIRWIPLTIPLFTGCIIGSSYFTPYPLRQIVKGIDYYWSSDKQIGTFEEMECDMLVRMKDWNKILTKFPNPESPAVYSAILLATYQTGEISQEKLYRGLFIPYDRRDDHPSIFNMGGGFLINRFGSLVSAFMVSDIALHVNLYNISQRAAFEAMEFIPNFNKSSRALKRLVETNIIIGEYQTALKYIAILEETLFYHQWAKKMRFIAENPQQIQNNLFYKKSQESFANTEDLFFL